MGSGGITGGNLEINNFSAVFGPDLVSSGSISSPDATTGRGTLVLKASSPSATYNLIYYLIDDYTALLLDQDNTAILTGVVARQY